MSGNIYKAYEIRRFSDAEQFFNIDEYLMRVTHAARSAVSENFRSKEISLAEVLGNPSAMRDYLAKGGALNQFPNFIASLQDLGYGIQETSDDIIVTWHTGRADFKYGNINVI